MLIGDVHGYRGLIRELVGKLRRELTCEHLPVVATGGYAALMARRLPEITAVDPFLTLTGLRIACAAAASARPRPQASGAGRLTPSFGRLPA
jgi:type III pantothenate kinase